VVLTVITGSYRPTVAGRERPLSEKGAALRDRPEDAHARAINPALE